MSKLYRIYRRFCRGIKNLYKWFSIIWKDEDWDYYYLYLIMKFKLENMSKYLRDYGVSTNADRDVENINKCVTILDKLIKDNYEIEHLEPHDKKWGEITMTCGEEKKHTTSEGKEETYTRVFLNRDKANTPEEKEQELKEFKALVKQGYLHKECDRRELFDLMFKHIEEWWD